MSAHTLEAILAMAAVTIFCRTVPFLFFLHRQPPSWMDFLQRYLPPMMMTVLVVGSFKGVAPAQWPHGIPELACSIAVAALHLWKRNALLSILAGTALYMGLLRLL